ncbi:MAG: M12 family metallo-peptidase [Phycisphaerales bacterium]
MPTRGTAARLLGCTAALFATTGGALAQGTLLQEGGSPAGQQSPLVFDDLIEYSIERLDFQAKGDGSVTTEVLLGEQLVTVELWPHSVRSPAFEVLVQRDDGSMDRIVPPSSTTYRGHVEGIDGSVVSAGLYGGSLTALVSIGDDATSKWVIEPLSDRVPGADDALHVVFSEDNDLSGVDGFCGTIDAPLGGLIQGDPLAPSVDNTLRLELAVDTDFEFYQSRGSSEPAVIAAVEAQVNSVSSIYERDVDTVIEITTIIVRPTSSDPYTTSDGGGLLQQMTNHWRSQQTGVRRDTASLISGRNFAGGTLGVAWLSGLCTTTLGYNVNQYVSLSTAARVAVLAHEIGHNCNARHCSGGDCRIMCAGIGGCAGDIRNFGASSRSVIRSFLESRPCIDDLVTEPDPQPLPFVEDFDDSTSLDPQRWAESDSVNVTPSVVNPITPPNGLNFQVDGTMTTTRYDVPFPTEADTYVSIWSQHRFVEPGKFLNVEYFSGFTGAWEPLGTIESDGSAQQQFILNEWKLPLEAPGDEFRLRITSVGADAADAWFIDSVSIDEFCRVDMNEDGVVNLFDFLAFQTAFDGGSPFADFNNDTELNVFDFLEFQNQFSQGCP